MKRKLGRPQGSKNRKKKVPDLAKEMLLFMSELQDRIQLVEEKLSSNLAKAEPGWEDAGGRRWRIRDMSTDHIRNAMNHLESRDIYTDAYQQLKSELNART